MFEQTFKNIDDILHKDAGCGSELDYVEQTSWILFLKYLNDLEKDKEAAAALSGKTYKPIISAEFKWDKWATPKTKDGKLDHHKALTGGWAFTDCDYNVLGVGPASFEDKTFALSLFLMPLCRFKELDLAAILLDYTSRS